MCAAQVIYRMRLNFGKLLQVAMPAKARSPSSFGTSSSSLGIHLNQKANGTIRATSNFNAEQAAKKIHAAFHNGMDTDVSAIMDVLTTHSNKQRQSIKRHYKILNEKTLETDVYDYLAGNFRDISLMLLQTPLDFLAEHIHFAIQKVGPEEDTMIELLWGCSNSRIRQIKETYRKKYGRDLDMVVKRELNSDFQRLMRVLLTTDRSEAPEVDLELARKDAQMLESAGVGVRYETDDVVIASLLYQRSYAHLREMFEQFYNFSGHSVEDSIRAEFNGGIRNGLISLSKAVIDPTAFFAEQMHNALKEPNPNDSKLIRLLVARSEIDLADIKDCYLHVYGQKLASDVSDIASGAYRRYLLHLLGQYDD